MSIFQTLPRFQVFLFPTENSGGLEEQLLTDFTLSGCESGALRAPVVPAPSVAIPSAAGPTGGAGAEQSPNGDLNDF
jgi:hypothetical protein